MAKNSRRNDTFAKVVMPLLLLLHQHYQKKLPFCLSVSPTDCCLRLVTQDLRRRKNKKEKFRSFFGQKVSLTEEGRGAELFERSSYLLHCTGGTVPIAQFYLPQYRSYLRENTFFSSLAFITVYFRWQDIFWARFIPTTMEKNCLFGKLHLEIECNFSIHYSGGSK